MNNKNEKINRCHKFVAFIIELIKKDKGIAAALRRSDNPATEYQSWEYLAVFNIDLEKKNQRLPHVIIAAAIAKTKIEEDGKSGIGKAIADCYQENSASDQAKAKLRRLMACKSLEEVCSVLRNILGLIQARTNIDINFSLLLYEVLAFNFRAQQIKSRWAKDFYSYRPKKEEIACS